MDSAKDRWNSASAHVTSGTKRIRDVPARVRKALPREAPGSTAYTQTVWMSPDESEVGSHYNINPLTPGVAYIRFSFFISTLSTTF